ncbi:hypothetical protein [Bacillus gaemokensis]|uniref:hypothetical protein n=1 Tax=Bacillus gaemokensis TaxID=574375 RepID=UPI001F2F3E4D|nr:hypothetical protein [Bacillus gaemokensis]
MHIFNVIKNQKKYTTILSFGTISLIAMWYYPDTYESIESFYQDFFAFAEKLLEMGKYYDLQFMDKKT